MLSQHILWLILCAHAGMLAVSLVECGQTLWHFVWRGLLMPGHWGCSQSGASCLLLQAASVVVPLHILDHTCYPG